jgi:2-dehydropantoate 2-reductase
MDGMHIVILGTGGVGGYFGASLAEAGNDVNFVARAAHLEAMRRRSLRVLRPLGDVVLPKVNVVEDVRQIDEAEFAFLTVKLWDSNAVVPQLAPLFMQPAKKQASVHKSVTTLNQRHGRSSSSSSDCRGQPQ